MSRLGHIRHTHTFVTLKVSRRTYAEIEWLLRDAGYDHAFANDISGAIDMTGIALMASVDVGTGVEKPSVMGRMLAWLGFRQSGRG